MPEIDLRTTEEASQLYAKEKALYDELIPLMLKPNPTEEELKRLGQVEAEWNVVIIESNSKRWGDAYTKCL